MANNLAYHVLSQSPEKFEKLFDFFEDVNGKLPGCQSDMTKHDLEQIVETFKQPLSHFHFIYSTRQSC
jgi:hypothetical protein